MNRHPTLLRGDARALPLPDNTVDLIVTSPPYFGLRSYTDHGVHYTGQVGSETTPGEFLDALIDCTREMIRVLKPSGSIFVNLGDKYSSGGRGTYAPDTNVRRHPSRQRPPGGAPKSLLLIPERYRIRCADDLGLIVRAVIVWNKPNGLPESVTDRVRRSHEDWVHLTKLPRYYSAIDEIREPHTATTTGRDITGFRAGPPGSWRGRATGRTHDDGSPIRDFALNTLGKLPGSVWTIATQPLKVPTELGVDHYAAFPMEWPRRLILGWSPREVCTTCGEGRRPVSTRTPMTWRESPTAQGRTAPDTHRKTASGTMLTAPTTQITGYTCACPDTTAPSRPGVVLDPFGGTGTTALVATMLGRTGISLDLSADYGRLAQWRANNPNQRARAAGGTTPRKTPAPPTPGQIDLFGGAA